VRLRCPDDSGQCWVLPPWDLHRIRLVERPLDRQHALVRVGFHPMVLLGAFYRPTSSTGVAASRCARYHRCTPFSPSFLHTRVVRACSFLFFGCPPFARRIAGSLSLPRGVSLARPPIRWMSGSSGPSGPLARPLLSSHSRIFPHDAMRFTRTFGHGLESGFVVIAGLHRVLPVVPELWRYTNAHKNKNKKDAMRFVRIFVYAYLFLLVYMHYTLSLRASRSSLTDL
jgi:hypothetical protein